MAICEVCKISIPTFEKRCRYCKAIEDLEL